MGRGSDVHHDGEGAARAAEPGAPAPGALTSPVREPSRPQPPPPPPAAALDVERFLRVEQFRSHAVRDGGEMRLHLSPDGLGEVHVRVVVRADAVEAALYAQHDHTREALQQHRPVLEAALGRANLRLEGFTVGLGEHRHAPSDHSHAGTYQPPVIDAGVLAAPVPVQPAELLLGPERGLSLRI
jgi:flagellar hook-length control protein FliK